MNRAAWALLLPLAVGGADQKTRANGASSLGAPSIGFVATASDKEARFVSGIIGASGVRGPASLGDDVVRVVVAPGQAGALIQRGEERTLEWATIRNGTFADSQPVGGSLAGAQFVVFSPSGSYAAVYSATARRIQVISGLPDRPGVASDYDAASFPADVTALAVSDGGSVLAAVGNGADTSFVASPSPEGGYRAVFNGAAVSAVRFVPGTEKVVIADRGANTISLLSRGGEDAGTTILAGEAQGVHDPVDLEASPDGGRIFVLNSGRRGVLMIDVAQSRTADLDCRCEPSALRRVAGSMLHVAAGDSESVWLLDMKAAEPWIAYAPQTATREPSR